jgi:hypothetical protein
MITSITLRMMNVPTADHSSVMPTALHWAITCVISS